MRVATVAVFTSTAYIINGILVRKIDRLSEQFISKPVSSSLDSNYSIYFAAAFQYSAAVISPLDVSSSSTEFRDQRMH